MILNVYTSPQVDAMYSTVVESPSGAGGAAVPMELVNMQPTSINIQVVAPFLQRIGKRKIVCFKANYLKKTIQT